MATRTPTTVAHGDGISPEIMAATLRILKEAGGTPTLKRILEPAEREAALGLEITMTVNLRTYDAKPGFTLAQVQ
jgi:isocitrate/isopropylmalate dehydrogenase